MTEFISNILNSSYLQYIMLAIRMLTPVLALFVVWRCFTSFKKGLRRGEPVLILRDKKYDITHPILYWENSIGRSKTCDVVLNDSTVSRDHAVLLRRELGWFVTDTESKAGIRVNGRKYIGRKLVGVGDTITVGQTNLVLESSDKPSRGKGKVFKGFTNRISTPFILMIFTNIVHLSMTFQLMFGTGEFLLYPLFVFLGLFGVGWLFYFASTRLFNRVSFEVENIAFLLSGIGISLLSGLGIEAITTQFISMVIGIGLFLILLMLMSKVDMLVNWNKYLIVLTILIFIANLVFGTEIYGAKNWIIIGGVSVQPSEIVKIIYIFVGASTLDKLQTKKNIGFFIAFTGVCMGFLFVMRDFGSSAIFFVTFLIIAFMRSGSIRTIALIIAVAIIGVVMIIYFRPYVADRFAGWGNVWEHINDSYGYQQTRTLTYIASGGLFGMGLGNGYLHYVAAGDSDLVFGMLCEEQGLLMGAVVVLSLVLFVLMASSDVKRSRSSFYSIASHAAVGILVFQACLNIFGSTDILPLTGVTLPFISSGGSSLISVWGLVSFLKASDERTYALKRKAGAKR